MTYFGDIILMNNKVGFSPCRRYFPLELSLAFHYRRRRLLAYRLITLIVLLHSNLKSHTKCYPTLNKKNSG